MRNFLSTAVAAAMILVSSATLVSCDKDFDNPPVGVDPALVANTTIKDLKALHTVAGAYNTVTSDIIISGIVTADDRSGNLYKQLFIQDSTGAINVLLDAASLYGTYPVGRKVFIKCNGLTVSDYHGLMQLGYKAYINNAPSLEAIPSALISNYLFGGTLNNPVVPKVVTASQLGTNMQDANMGVLIQLNGYEFDAADTLKTFGDTSSYKNSNDLYISPGCGAPTTAKLDVRSSGYANFAGLRPQSGSGNIISIYTVYNTTKQLLIRDTSDIQFNGTRCGGPVGTVLLSETFDGQSNNVDIAITGWNNLSEVGSKKWYDKLLSGNNFANISAFGSAQASVKTWLVTKAINLGAYATKTLSFKTSQGYSGAGGILAASLKVLVSTNYTGTGNPWTSTWTDISSQAILSPGMDGGYPAFITSGPVSLNAYTGTIYIAFVYEGADPTGTASDKTSTWEIDDILVAGN